MPISFDLSEGQISNAIAIALAEAFNPDTRDAMLRDVIRAHLSVKQNSYDKETLLSREVGNTIRRLAGEAMRERLDEMAPKIREIVRAALGPQFEQQVLDQLKLSLGRLTVANIQIKAEAVFDRDND